MWFKLKDYFTIFNVFCGLGVIAFVLEGHSYWFGFLICFSWVCDFLDGLVVRLTKIFNQFGSEFDSMCDYLIYGIVFGFFIYGVYRDWFPMDVGFYGYVLLFLFVAILFVIASIWVVRFVVKPIKVSGFWIGLLRSVSAFIIVGFCNGSIFSLWSEVAYFLGMALVLLLGVFNLGSIFFLSHHGRVWTKVVVSVLIGVLIVYGGTMIVGSIALLFGAQWVVLELFFDVVFFFFFGYMLLQWYGVWPDEWKQAKEVVVQWRKQPNPQQEFIMSVFEGLNLQCKGAVQQVVLQMLMNNLHLDVVEDFEALVVYGGSGKVVRNPDVFRTIVRSFTDLEDDEILLI